MAEETTSSLVTKGLILGLLDRIESLETEASKNDERIAFLEDELEARVKLAEQFYTAKS